MWLTSSDFIINLFSFLHFKYDQFLLLNYNTSLNNDINELLLKNQELKLVKNIAETNQDADGKQEGNVYTGTHYSITASYVDGTKPEDKLVQATGTEPIGTVTSDVEATVTATETQYVYVKIIIKVIKPILSDLDNHVFTVAFSAETTASN